MLTMEVEDKTFRKSKNKAHLYFLLQLHPYLNAQIPLSL